MKPPDLSRGFLALSASVVCLAAGCHSPTKPVASADPVPRPPVVIDRPNDSGPVIVQPAPSADVVITQGSGGSSVRS